MKGLVFVELLEMAESLLGEQVVDEVLDECALSTGGAYNAVGNYPCSELMTLVQAFGRRSGVPTGQLQRDFGSWMHQHFETHYPHFFADKHDPLTMLEAIENEVHVEVRKLYPEAELPRFDSVRLDDGQALRLTYHSPRALGDFCHGLVDACIAHFGQPTEVTRRDLSVPGETVVEFTVRLVR